MEMVRRGARALVGGFRPVDRLDGIDKTPGRQSSTIKDTSSPQQPLSSPIKTKVQQKNSTLAHTSAHFIPSQPQYGASVKTPPNPRKRSFDKATTTSDGSQSQNTGISGALSFGHSNVPEYRNTIRIAKAKKRQRYRGSGTTQQEIHDDPIIVDDFADDDVQVVPSNGQQEILNRTRPDELGQEYSTNTSLETTDPFLQKRKRSGDSPDDLAPTLAEIEAKRRKPEHMRGHINRAKFVFHGNSRSHTAARRPPQSHKDPVLEKSLKIIGQGLQLRRAVSGSKTYDDATEPDVEHLMLALSEMSFILHPLAKDGTIATELQWCTVNLHKVQWLETAQPDTDSPLIYISRSSDASTSSSGLLALHFVESEHVRAFVDWCSIHKNVSLPRRLSNERLEKKFDVAWTEAEKQQQSALSEAVKLSHKPDDIALIEQNHARRNTAPSRPTETNAIKRPKLKDTMSATEKPATSNDLYTVPVELSLSPRRAARNTRASFVLREPSPILPCAPSWTSQNPKWSDKWRNSIVFPATGKNRAVVDKADIERLDEGEFLNDNLIIFYLRYLQVNLETHSKGLAERIYFHNTFFFERLKPTRSGAGISYDNVKGWTTKVDLFSKDFIVVPINEHSHWYVAIICNAPKLLEQETPEKEDTAREEDRPNVAFENPPTETVQVAEPRSSIERVVSDLPGPCEAQLAANMSHIRVGSPETALDAKEGFPPNQAGIKNTLSRKKSGKRQSTGRRKDPTKPRIITLDSLSSSHSPACGYLKQYLVAELKDKKGIDIADPGAMGMTARNIPVQQNFCDCGLYLLGYIKKFLEDPDTFVRSIMDQNDIDWNLDPSALRNDIRELLFTLQEEQQKQEDLEAEDRKQRKRKVFKAKQEQEAKNSKPGSPAQSSAVPTVPAHIFTTELAQSPPLAVKQPIQSVEVSHLLLAATEASPSHRSANRPAHEASVVLDPQESVTEIPVISLQDDQAPAKDQNSSIIDVGQAFMSLLPESSAESSSPAPRDESKTLPDDPNRLHSKANGARDEPGRQRRIEISLPQIPNTSNRPGPERHLKSSPGKKTGESSHYFAGKRYGDQPGRARLHRTPPGGKAQQSAVIELPSDSD